MDAVIVIPARGDSTRLPNKPMALVRGKPMVERVLEACYSSSFRVVVATDSDEVEAHMRPHCPVIRTGECRTGTDRVAEAVAIAGIQDEIIINVQCDMPFITWAFPQLAYEALRQHPQCDWSTLWAHIAPVCFDDDLGFVRRALCQHIGVYAFRRELLVRFRSMPRSQNETTMDLEQMRLVDNDIDGVFWQAPYAPLEVNTPEDLQLANHCG